MDQSGGLELGENIETLFKIEPPCTSVKKGFGYMGVLLRNNLTDQLQCHICGEWFSGLSFHVWHKHHIKSRDYRFKFGLPLGFPLVGRQMSARYSESAIRQGGINKFKGLRDYKKATINAFKNKKVNRHRFNSDSFLNKKGLCEAQMLKRFLIVSDIVNKEPSALDVRKYDPALEGAIWRKFKTFNNFRKHHNFTVIPQDPKNYTDEFIISAIRKFAIEHHRIPFSSDFIKGTPTYQAIYKRFGSWNRVLKMAGFINNNIIP